MAKKKKKKSVNMWQIARLIGLDSILCAKCGNRAKGGTLLEDFFQKVLDECKKGKVVKIKNFGSFEAKELKGRTVKSPLLDGGAAEMDDILVLRFHVTAKARRTLNGRPDPYRTEQEDEE